MRIVWAMPLLLLTLGGCRDKAKSAPPEPSPAAPGRSSSVAEPDARIVRCTDVLVAGDVQAACGVAVAMATPAASQDDIGPGRTCSRRFTTAKAGSVSFMITLLDDASTARGVFDTTTRGMIDIEPVIGLGDAARRFTKTRSGDDTVLNVELIKGRLNVLLFSARVPLAGKVIEPVCSMDQLVALARTLAARL